MRNETFVTADPLDRGSRVLVLFPGALGDAVCLEPAIAYLAQSGPTVVHARGAAAEVAALFPARPEVRSLDGVEIARLFSAGDDPATERWLARFARVVSFTGADVPAVAQRIGATRNGIVVHFPRPPLEVHATDYFLRAVRGDTRGDGACPRLVAPEGAAPPSERARLALLPGGSSAAKRAPRELLAELASRWRAARGEVDVVLGPAETDEDDAWRRLGRIVRPADVAGLAAYLATSSAFVGNDSGPSHVAAALGVPGVVLYTTTDPAHFGPRGAAITSLRLRATADPASAAWAVLAARLP